MADLLFQAETYRILGSCFSVYRDKGCGFLEAVYQECLTIDFEEQGIPFVEQKPLALHYRGRTLKQTYKADFICFGNILLELKAVSHLADEHRAQILNYLHSTGLTLGLLLNIGHYPKLEYERIALTQRSPAEEIVL